MQFGLPSKRLSTRVYPLWDGNLLCAHSWSGGICNATWTANALMLNCNPLTICKAWVHKLYTGVTTLIHSSQCSRLSHWAVVYTQGKKRSNNPRWTTHIRDAIHQVSKRNKQRHVFERVYFVYLFSFTERSKIKDANFLAQKAEECWLHKSLSHIWNFLCIHFFRQKSKVILYSRFSQDFQVSR